MKISEKRRKWLTIRAFRNCFLVSVGVVIISYLFELTRMIISAKLPFPQSILFGLFGLMFLTAWLWILGFLYPEYIETAFTMLGFKEKEENKDND